MKTILIPTDFSKEAEGAVTFGLSLADNANANVILYHAYEANDAPQAAGRVERLEERLVDMGRTDVHIMKQSLEDKSQFIDGLWESAKARNVDLIITGTKGIDSYFGIQEDSNSSTIIQGAPCPVLTLKNKGLSNVESILVTSEFIQGDTDKEFKAVSEIVKLFDATVTFLYVDQDNKHAVSMDDIESFASKWGIENFEGEIVGDTTTASAIFEVAKEVDADLVVMGYHKDRIHQHELYGSLAGDFINHSKYPVLTIHL